VIRLLPAIPLLHFRELAVKIWQLVSRAGIGNVLLLGLLSPGRATTDLKPTRLLSEQRIDQPSSTLRRKRASRAEA
jgi:hypothetical protein